MNIAQQLEEANTEVESLLRFIELVHGVKLNNMNHEGQPLQVQLHRKNTRIKLLKAYLEQKRKKRH